MAMIPGKSLLPELFKMYPELGVRIVGINDNTDFPNGIEVKFGPICEEITTERHTFWIKAIAKRVRGTISFTWTRKKPRKITFRTNLKYINQRRYNGHKKPNK